jgi:chromate transporter
MTDYRKRMGDVENSNVSLWKIFSSYLLVGLTAFSMAILQKLKSLVMRNKWLSEEDMNEGLALVQMYPGPLMVDFTAYVGYKLRGVPGAIIATLGFILPSFLMMIGLSSLYFAAANLSWIHLIFSGLEALVVGVILNVTLDLGAKTLKGKIEAVIALLAFAVLLFKVNAIWVVLASLVLGALFIRPELKGPVIPHSKSSTPLRKWISIAIVAFVVLAVAAFAWSLKSTNGLLALSLFKIGSVAFGNGTTIIPLIQADVVDVHHWLTMNQFVDGIALGQITPGPFLITATFIGFKMGGILGATLATFAMFSPSFVMTLVFTELFVHVRNLKAVRGALAGVLASFTGMLAVVILQLSNATMKTPASFAFAAAAFIAVRWFKMDVIFVFAGGLVLWIGLMALHIV